MKLTGAILEAEYDSLRSDNTFKKYKDGRDLFFKWRLRTKKFTTSEIAKKMGVTSEALHNLTRRLDKKQSRIQADIDSGVMSATIKKKHIKKISETAKAIKEGNDLGKLGKGKDKDPTAYDLMNHIQDELTLIGGPETDDWMDLLLYVSKYVFINELSIYRTFINRLLYPETEEDYKNKGLYASITDKKVGKIREMINDHIGQWGTLHTQAVSETINEQTQKIESLAKMVVETSPDKMVEVMELLDGKEETEDADSIIADIMKDIPAEPKGPDDRPSVVRL